MDWKLELIVIPVSDVDRAKAFYGEQAGFRLLVDHRAGEGFRVVQMVPPGSACAIAFGMLPAGPGSPVKGLHLIVDDIEEARAELVQRGTDVSDFFHFAEGGRTAGMHPTRESYGTFCSFDDPDGNGWLVQEVNRA